MKSDNRWRRYVAAAAVLLALGSGAAFAQLQTGNLYGKVTDQGKAALPGVTVTLDTGEAPQVQVTNAQGEFRFLGLAPASYNLKARLEGFAPIERPGIVISVGHNTHLDVVMIPPFTEKVFIIGNPVLDESQFRPGTDVS